MGDTRYAVLLVDFMEYQISINLSQIEFVVDTKVNTFSFYLTPKSADMTFRVPVSFPTSFIDV